MSRADRIRGGSSSVECTGGFGATIGNGRTQPGGSRLGSTPRNVQIFKPTENRGHPTAQWKRVKTTLRGELHIAVTLCYVLFGFPFLNGDPLPETLNFK
jgi:hypothetical protein